MENYIFYTVLIAVPTSRWSLWLEINENKKPSAVKIKELSGKSLSVATMNLSVMNEEALHNK